MAIFDKDQDVRALADTLPGVGPGAEDGSATRERISWNALETAADLVGGTPRVVHLSTPLLDLVRLIRGEGRGALPVVDRDGKLCGIVTSHDLVLRGYSQDKPTTAITARDVMSHHPHEIRLDESIEQLVETMTRHRLHWVPVVDAEHRVAGLISEDDVAIRAEYDPAMRAILARSASRRSRWQRFWH